MYGKHYGYSFYFIVDNYEDNFLTSFPLSFSKFVRFNISSSVIPVESTVAEMGGAEDFLKTFPAFCSFFGSFPSTFDNSASMSNLKTPNI